MTADPLQPTRQHAGGAPRPAIADAWRAPVRTILATPHLWHRRRRDRRELLKLALLDRRMLADLGITRGEAEFLANKPFWRE